MSETRARTLFGISLVASLVLAIAPSPVALPEWLEMLRPEWIILCWYFWVIFQSRICSLLVAFLVGFVADVLLDEPLGLNSIILLSMLFLSNQAIRVIIDSPVIRSTIVLFVLCFLTSVVKALVMNIAYDIEIVTISLILPALTTTIFWLPLVPAITSDMSQLNE